MIDSIKTNETTSEWDLLANFPWVVLDLMIGVKLIEATDTKSSMPYFVTQSQQMIESDLSTLCLVNFRVPNKFFYHPVILACTALLTHLSLPDFASSVPTTSHLA